MKKITTIIIVLAMVMTIGMSTVSPVFGEEGTRADPNPPEIMSVTPVRINNDTDLASAASFGSGTWNDPYILEYDIDAEGYNYGLYIGNTTEHFILQNSIINGTNESAVHPYWVAGLHLHNVENANITNCTIYDHRTYGIWLNGTSNITLWDNNIWDIGLRAIDVFDSDDNYIMYNNLQGNDTTIFGIAFDDLSDDNMVVGNTIQNYRLFSIGFNDSWSLTIENNNIIGNNSNPSFGIFAYNSLYLETNVNTISGFTIGILFYNSSESTFLSNDISECAEGMNMTFSEMNDITGGTFDDILTNGIGLGACEYINITSVTINNTDTGIHVGLSEEIEITNCTFTIDATGVKFVNTNDSMVSYSNFDDLAVGTDISNCESITVLNCTFNNIAFASIGSMNTNDTAVVGCEITDSAYGIVSLNTTTMVIYQTIINTSTNGGIIFSEGSYLLIYECNITNSGTFGSIYLNDTIEVYIMNNSFVNSDTYHVTLTNVTNATCSGNYFYTAEFGDAYDDGNNTWYYDETTGGNYWCNYTGVDADEDGFGDTPYNITGGTAQDLYPIFIGEPEETDIYQILYDNLVAMLIPVLGILVVLIVFSSVLKTVSPKKGKRK